MEKSQGRGVDTPISIINKLMSTNRLLLKLNYQYATDEAKLVIFSRIVINSLYSCPLPSRNTIFLMGRGQLNTGCVINVHCLLFLFINFFSHLTAIDNNNSDLNCID